MCFPRKPSLGRYTGSRSDWKWSYRAARVAARNGLRPDPTTAGLLWKAQLIVSFERSSPDPLATPGPDRLAFKQLLDEILAVDNPSGVQA